MYVNVISPVYIGVYSQLQTIVESLIINDFIIHGRMEGDHVL